MFEANGTALYPRPDVIPGVPLVLYGAGFPGGKIFNATAFTAAPQGKQGDFGRNVLRGFDATQADLGLQRAFRLTEKVGLRLRGEFFNVLNHPNFGRSRQQPDEPPVWSVDADAGEQFGVRQCERRFQPLHQIGGPRSVQLVLKVVF